MRHTGPFTKTFGDLAKSSAQNDEDAYPENKPEKKERVLKTNAKKQDIKEDQPGHNEFVNNGQYTQAQLQKLLYRRQMLISKGQYHVADLGLLASEEFLRKLDDGDRQLLEDYLAGRTIEQHNQERFNYHLESMKLIDVSALDNDTQRLLSAIETSASKSEHVTQSYLINLACKESSFGKNMVADTSSACGAYQFIESTWLNTVKQYGHEIGLGQYADLIEGSGRNVHVINDDFKQKILDLRFDHDVSAHMAMRLTEENRRALERMLPGREISDTDLYIAHFLGSTKAVDFLLDLENNPTRIAATKHAEAANANRWVFFNRKENALSFDEVYSRFERDFEDNRPINQFALQDRDHAKKLTADAA